MSFICFKNKLFVNCFVVNWNGKFDYVIIWLKLLWLSYLLNYDILY